MGGSPVGPGTVEGTDLPISEFEYRWAEVNQATGMVSVQLDSELTAAFLRLCAHAYLTGRLSQVARDVTERRLRFEGLNQIPTTQAQRAPVAERPETEQK